MKDPVNRRTFLKITGASIGVGALGPVPIAWRPELPKSANQMS